jgi:hypothetical protein
MVKAFKAVKFGNVKGPVPVQFNTKLEEEVVVILFTLADGYAPFKVSVLLPNDKFPEVKVSVFATVKL